MRRPFEQSYAVSLTIAIAVLIPYILTTTASPLYQDTVIQDIGATRAGLELTTGMSEAGYAFGALLGGDIGQRFPQRPAWLTMTAVLAITAILATIAWSPAIYAIGIIGLGLSTGMLVILSLPPVIRRFGPERLPISAAFVNIGFFGASAAGPLLGGLVAAGGIWRGFHALLALVSGLAFIFGLLTLPDGDPPNRDLPFDASGILLGLLAMPLLFFGTSELVGHWFGSPFVLVPLCLGAACFVALLTTEASKKEPLSPIKPMWTTYPAVGVLSAMFGGGAFISFVILTLQFLQLVALKGPLAIGIAFAPQIAGALLGAAALSFALPRGFLPLLILAGAVSLLGSGWLLLASRPEGGMMPLIALLLGFGAGATVSPGLYLSGFSLPSPLLGRCFALVELMRAAADYSMAPVVRYSAQVHSAGETIDLAGFRHGVRVTLITTTIALVIGAAIYLAGKGFALPRPDIAGWLKDRGPAITSPPLGARLSSSRLPPPSR
jgi:MFS family permease